MPGAVTANVKVILAFGDGAPKDASLDEFRPPDPSHFGVSVQVLIGAADDEWSDSFDLVVCTPSWMAAQVEAGSWDRFRSGGLNAIPEAVAVGSGIWFMRHWERVAFLDAINAVCTEFSPGPDWGTVASRIGRLIPWEFDYRYDEHVSEHYGEPFPPNR